MIRPLRCQCQLAGCVLLIASISCRAQATLPIASPQSALSQALLALGGHPPNDEVIAGNVRITAGTTDEQGTVRIVTKGVTHTVETFDMPTTSRKLVFANGVAAERAAKPLKELPYGRMLTARSAISPLTFLTAKLAEPRVTIADVGLEEVGGLTTHHFQISNDWAGDKRLAAYQSFSKFEVWLDPKTSLPQAISYNQRDGLGAIPWVAVRIEYDDYRSLGDSLYPYHIIKFVNGTKWADIQVTSITVNNGVSQSEFAIK